LEESQKGGPELVVAGRDTAELFELVEEAFNLVALAVERFSPAKALLAPNHVGDVGDGATRLELGSETIGVVGLVGDDDGASINRGKERLGAGQVVGLPGRD
jgi:hypothetical protein